MLFSSRNFFQVNAGAWIFIYYVNEVFKGNIFMLIDFPEYVWKILWPMKQVQKPAGRAGISVTLTQLYICTGESLVVYIWRMCSSLLAYTAKLLLLLGGGQALVNSHKHLLYIKVGLLREIMRRGMDYFCRKVPFV